MGLVPNLSSILSGGEEGSLRDIEVFEFETNLKLPTKWQK